MGKVNVDVSEGRRAQIMKNRPEDNELLSWRFFMCDQMNKAISWFIGIAR